MRSTTMPQVNVPAFIRGHKIMVVIVIGVGTASFASMQGALPAASEGLPSVTHPGIEWLRVVGGVVGFLFAIIGAVAYGKALSKMNTVKALEETNTIYKDQSSALQTQIAILNGAMMEEKKNYQTVVEIARAKDLELTQLRTRTDLTEVLKPLQQLLSMKEASDARIMETLTTAIGAGDKKYVQVTDALSKILEHLSAQSRELLAASTRNYEILMALTKSADALSRRFGVVEKSVSATKKTVEALAADDDTIDSADDVDQETEGERRRNPR